MKKALILLNLGTPLNPSVEGVRAYLREFLMDPYVIELPTPIRWLLVNGIIAPFRAPKSAHAYQSIWTDEGSPLLVYTKRFVKKLKAEVPPDWTVETGMTYGSPSFDEALKNVLRENVSEIHVVPLFPQWAMAAGGAAIYGFRKVLKNNQQNGRLVSANGNPVKVKFLRDYHDSENYISALASDAREYENEQAASLTKTHYLLSYHSLPDKPNATEYKEQCYKTSELLAKKMGWQKDKDYTVSFQSRLGRAKWIQPYTASVLAELPKRGIKNLTVMCPGFSVDCLETLEEINIGGREIFMEAGGESFNMLPCLNDHDVWVKSCLAMLGEPGLTWMD